jgi:hypothetical protein
VLFKGATGVDGAPAISAILGNETHIFPAAFDGTISGPSYAGSGTTIRVYEGAQELEYTGTGTSVSTNEPGTWKLWVFPQGGYNNISIGTFTDSGNYATVGDHSGVAQGIDVASITYNIFGRNSLGTQFNITKTQTFSKSKTGAGGTSARSVDLTTGTQAFAYTETGTTPAPTNTVVTATATNTSGTVYYEFLIGTTSKQNTVSNTYTYTPTTTYAGMPEQITVKIREGANNSAVLATDTMTMIGIKPGATGKDAISGLLTNESAVVSTNNDGSGGVYTNAGGTFLVFDGVTPKTGVTGPNGVAYSVVVAETTTGLTVNIDTAGVYTASLNNATDSGSAKFRAVYGGVTIDKVYSIAKSRAGGKGDKGDTGDPGAPGGPGATGTSNYRIYKASANSATPPTTDNAAPPATTDGAAPSTWSLTPVTLTAGQAQWQSDGVRAAGTTGVANNTTWSVPYLSYFKVDTLEAITTNTGKLNVNDTIKVGTVTVNAQDNPVDGVLITTSGIKIYNAGILRVNLGSL